MDRPESKQQAPRFSDESGVALVTIIGFTAVVTLIAVVAVNFALRAQEFAGGHEDWNAALAVAEAGVDDYLARLNRDRTYYVTAEGDLDGDGLNPGLPAP